MDPIEVLLQEVRGYLDREDISLAAGTLEQYANCVGKKAIGEKEKEMCIKVVYQLLVKRDYESAERLYKSFGLDKELEDMLVIKSMREEAFGRLGERQASLE